MGRETSSQSSSRAGRRFGGPALDQELEDFIQTVTPEAWRPARTSTPPPAPSEPTEPVAAPRRTSLGTRSADELRAEAERRRGERYDLYTSVVRAVVEAGPQAASRGRVRNLAIAGGLFVETRAPLAFRTDVYVEFSLPDGRARTFSGRVVRQPDDGMGIQLRTDEGGRAFLVAFVDEALRPGTELPAVTVSAATSTEEASASEVALSERWSAVVDDWDAAHLHQRFIETCLRGRRLDYALERYRAVLAAQPDEPTATRHIAQLGTILRFCALRREPAEARPSRRWRLWTPAAVLGLLGLAVLGLFMYLQRAH